MKKFAKTVFMLVVLLAVAGMLFAGGSKESGKPSDPAKKSYHIGFSLDTYTNVIQVEMARLIKEACDKRGYKLTITDGEKNASKQIDDIKSMIRMKVDAIIVLPINGHAVAEGVEAAYAAKIPISTVLRDMPTVKDKYLTFSGCDDVELGTIAGKWIVDAVKGEGNIVYITGTPGLSTAENRTKGFRSVVDQYPKIKIVAQQTAKYSRSEAMTVMEAILKANPDIKAIWCANDEMAGGAFQAIDAAKRNGILLGGANFQKDAYQRILSGDQHADITTPPQMVIAALDASIKFLEGGKVEKTLYYPLDLITKENVGKFQDQVY